MTFDGRLLGGISVLSAVVEAGSFARAGEVMGLTQPAVSRAVARLEERIGIRIFNRTARAISLTDEGRLFYETVIPHLSGIEDAVAIAGGSKVVVSGRLRINTDGTFGHSVLVPKIGQFLDRYPDLSIEISVRDKIGDLVAEGFDAAIRFGEPEPSSLRARLLLKTRVLTCASESYIARHGEPKHPNDLLTGHQCVLIRNPSTGRPFEWEFQRGTETIPIPPFGRLTVNDTASLVGACLDGVGIAQLLELYARDLLTKEKLIHILPDWADETFPLYAYHPSSHLVSAKARAFLEFVWDLSH